MNSQTKPGFTRASTLLGEAARQISEAARIVTEEASGAKELITPIHSYRSGASYAPTKCSMEFLTAQATDIAKKGNDIGQLAAWLGSTEEADPDAY